MEHLRYLFLTKIVLELFELYRKLKSCGHVFIARQHLALGERDLLQYSPDNQSKGTCVARSNRPSHTSRVKEQKRGNVLKWPRIFNGVEINFIIYLKPLVTF